MNFYRIIFKSDEAGYVNKVKRYFERNINDVITGIISLKNIENLDIDKFMNIFNEPFPICSKYKKSDYKNQIKCFFIALNLDINLKKRKQIKKAYEEYSKVVHDYIHFSRKNIYDDMSEYLQKYKCKLTYENISKMLGNKFPVISFAKYADDRIAMLIFLNEVQMIFKCSKNWVYFI